MPQLVRYGFGETSSMVIKISLLLTDCCSQQLISAAMTAQNYWPFCWLLNILLLSVFHSAVNCGQPPDVLNAVKSVEATTYSSNVTYTCVVGFFFARLVYTQTATCQANGTWSIVALEQCTRKPNKPNLFKLLKLRLSEMLYFCSRCLSSRR